MGFSLSNLDPSSWSLPHNFTDFRDDMELGTGNLLTLGQGSVNDRQNIGGGVLGAAALAGGAYLAAPEMFAAGTTGAEAGGYGAGLDWGAEPLFEGGVGSGVGGGAEAGSLGGFDPYTNAYGSMGSAPFNSYDQVAPLPAWLDPSSASMGDGGLTAGPSFGSATNSTLPGTTPDWWSSASAPGAETSQTANAGMGIRDYLGMGAFGLSLGNYIQNRNAYRRAQDLQNQRESARSTLAAQWADPTYRYNMLKNDPAFQATQDRIINEQRRLFAAQGVSNPTSNNYSTPMANALASNANSYQNNIFNQRAQAAGVSFNPGSTDVGLANAFQPAVSRSLEQTGQGLMASLGQMEQSGALPRIFQSGRSSA